MDENQEKTVKSPNLPNDFLMKPFKLGWKREVVNRVITRNGSPNCDIYYFSPNGKRFRSLTEMKTNLSDGLTIECFSFKRELLGLDNTYETVRSARVKGRNEKILKRSRQSKPAKSASEKDSNEKEPNSDEAKDDTLEEKKGGEKSNTDQKEEKGSGEGKSVNSQKKLKTKGMREVNEQPSVSSIATRARKEALKRVLRVKEVKQAQVVASKKILKKIVKKTGAKSPKAKLIKGKVQKETDSKVRNTKKKSLISKTSRKSGKTDKGKAKTDMTKAEPSTSGMDKRAIANDLKSIVQKNIGRYRELREKQKSGSLRSQSVRPKVMNKVNVSRPRSEPISKNIKTYLKPFEKGWRRELVFRMNCANAGHQADVYYFHPSGRKLRSCREISENLTPGLTLECFTFRKEPLGCGEPLEVVRNARTTNKFLQAKKKREA